MLVVLIVLYVGSQLVSTLLMSATADKNQRMIFLALPFFFVAFIWQFPAGLLVYWITTNLWTIVQQSIIKKRLGPLREQAVAAAKAAKETGRRSRPRAAAASGKSDGKGGGARRALGRLSKPAEPDERERRRPSAAGGPPPGAAAQEEEALGEAPVSDDSAADRVRELLEHVNEALALDADGRDRAGRGRRHPRHPRTATTSACSSAATARRSTPSSTSPSRSPRPRDDGRRSAWSSTPPATASAASRRCSARPTRPPSDAVRSGRPVALDAMSATERKVVHEYLKDREDVETYSEGTEPDRHLVVAPLD